jgi:aromatic ring-opening dioxygenase catalytic subunit (LigB family)
MREFGRANVYERSVAFGEWLNDAVTGDAARRDERLADWTSAPFARFCHPREEHLIPLLVVAGAAGSDVGHVTWSGRFIGSQQIGYHFG